jgi:peptide deformylase
MLNSDYMVQMREPEFDRQCLRRELFPVNMRLFQSSDWYKKHIEGIIDYMKWSMSQRWKDYQSNPAGGTYGISCANLGMAYNIIGWRKNDDFEFMINPKIVESSTELFETKSNCGSIKYKEKIPVKRPKWVVVEYYDVSGVLQKNKFTGKEAGYTIQHEIDHNLGILISDRFVEQGGNPEFLNTI